MSKKHQDTIKRVIDELRKQNEAKAQERAAKPGPRHHERATRLLERALLLIEIGDDQEAGA